MKQEQQENSSLQGVLLILLVVIVIFDLFIFAYKQLSLTLFALLTDSFNKIAVGTAAILGVIVGQKWVFKQEEKDKKIKQYLRQFPHDKFNEVWQIIEPKSVPGAYYIFEPHKNTVHHILNMKTVYDLGWHVYLNTSKKVNDKIFRSYTVGDRIRTQGEAGE